MDAGSPLYYHTRDPDPVWQERLEGITPRSEKVNWLYLKWFPGMPYEPVQRWCIWELVPDLDLVPPDLLMELDGQSPRHESQGYWDEDPDLDQELDSPLIKRSHRGIVQRWVSLANICLEEWEIFRETRCAANRTWIVQGDNGGHLYRMTRAELGVLEANGIKDADTPFPGDLPYAPMSDLTILKLAEMDWLRKWEKKEGKSFDVRTGLSKSDAGILIRRERRDREIEYNKRMLKWLDDQIEGAICDELPRAVLPQPSETARPVRVDEDKIDEEFIMDTPTRA